MTDFVIEIRDILPYLYFFPIYLLILFIIFAIRKKNINKGIDFYGMFMGLHTSNVISLSSLFLYLYVVLVSVFLTHFSFAAFLLILASIMIANIFNLSIISFVIDIINTLIIGVLLYTKMVLYDYMIEVNAYWYVIVLYVLLSVFLVFYIIFIFFRRFKSIISKNEYIKIPKKKKKKKVENKQ